MESNESPIDSTRVLFVVESFSTGVYAIVRDIACNLDKNVFQIHIIHSLRSDSPKVYVHDFDYPHISLEFVEMGSFFNYPSAIRRIRRRIREFSPHAIHLHSSKAGVLGRIASMGLNDLKRIYSPHGFSFLRTDVGRLHRKLYYSIEKLIDLFIPATIIAVSNGELKQAKRISSKTLLIPNFVDVGSIVSHGTTAGQLKDILTTGRISPQKNPKLFNQIASRLPQMAFTWVGDGPSRKDLSASNVTITGLVPRNDAIEMVNKAEIYIQTSLWEGMPVSILEAMAAGKPVVCTDIIGNRDLVAHGKTGMLFKPDDIEGFVEAIEQLHGNEILRDKIGKQAHEYVERNHNLKIAIKAYQKLYEGELSI